MTPLTPATPPITIRSTSMGGYRGDESHELGLHNHINSFDNSVTPTSLNSMKSMTPIQENQQNNITYDQNPSLYNYKSMNIPTVGATTNMNHSLQYGPWMEPDELFIENCKKTITLSDKKIFWEMAQAIMEFPIFAENRQIMVSNSTELANIMKRPEFKVLWIPEAAEILPKDAATELIINAYVGIAIMD